jgi:hypothetical protein
MLKRLKKPPHKVVSERIEDPDGPLDTFYTVPVRGLASRDRRLLRLAADAAEQSYRRGVQQGAVAMRSCVAKNNDPAALERAIAAWRFQRRPYRASVGAPGLGPPEKDVTVLDRFQRETAGETFYDFLHGFDRP